LAVSPPGFSPSPFCLRALKTLWTSVWFIPIRCARGEEGFEVKHKLSVSGSTLGNPRPHVTTVPCASRPPLHPLRHDILPTSSLPHHPHVGLSLAVCMAARSDTGPTVVPPIDC
jgi:hypothetical protein